MHSEGVTLIEALVTLGIVSIVLAIGVPAVRDIVATNRMSVAVNDLVTSLHISRNEAVKRTERSILCASTDWNAAGARCQNGNIVDGWIVFVDDNPRNGVRDAGETLVLGHGPLGQGIVLTAPNNIQFSDLGIATANTPGDEINFLFCDERGNRVSGGVTAGRRINMTATGRPQVVATPAEVAC
ncbi:MAG: hypothetical protein HKN81_11840 [Gammaproteobacteria bacterium]|nr:hypothetical protein [Gammaproteobacteria bacterium]